MATPEEETQKKSWHDLEPELQNFAQRINPTLIYAEHKGPLAIEYFFCQPIMDLAHFLRISTKAQELGGQHHTLKILFKYLKYGEEGKLEYPLRDGRADVYLTHNHRVIEVKTITQITQRKLYRQVFGVIDAQTPIPDLLWVFFFYKLKQPSPISPPCQYLLTFISIDLLDCEKESLKWELMTMVEESKIKAAEKLKMSPELFIPLENLLKVEDLERELAAKDQYITSKDQQLAAKEKQLSEKDREIAALRAKLKKAPK